MPAFGVVPQLASCTGEQGAGVLQGAWSGQALVRMRVAMVWPLPLCLQPYIWVKASVYD